MFSSRHTKCCATFLLLFIVLINIVSLDAKRSFGGGSRSRGSSSRGSSSSSSRGSSSSSSSSGRVSRPSAPVHIPTSFQPPRPHVPPSVPHTPPRSGPVNNGKDSSNVFIHSEGGGHPRPGSNKVTDHKQQQSTPHQPSAPNEPISKVTAGSVQGVPHGTNSYPPWANPGVAPNAGGNPHVPYPGSSIPHGNTFPNNGPINPAHKMPTAPYPPIHPPGPVSHQPIVPGHQSGVGAPHGTYPYPNSPHGMPAPYPPPAAPYPGGHPQGMPMPNAPHIGFGNGISSHQPLGTPHSYPSLGSSPMQPHSTVIHNHYNSPPVGSPQNPAGHPNFGHQPIYGGAPMGQPFVPGHTTILMPSQQSSGPGIGQLVKEALVFSTVNAGVNRLINGAPHHHDYHPAPVAASGVAPPASTSTVTNTVIYNNQYGTPVSGAAPVPGAAPIPATSTGQAVVPGSQPPFPAPPFNGGPNFPTGTPGNPSIGNSGTTSAGSPSSPLPNPPSGISPNSQPHLTPGNAAINSGTPNNTINNQTVTPVYQYYISNEELWTLTESLFAKNEYNASQYIELNLQNEMLDPNGTDVAPAPLLYVKWEGYAIPTIKVLRDMYNHYEFDANKKETVNDETRSTENIMLDTFVETDIMTMTMTWLSQKGYVEPESFEWKDTLRHIWMTKINGATSGFERIFLAEKYDGPNVLGGQNWVYFDSQEGKRLINYMGYVEKKDLGRTAHLVKINFKIDDIVKPNTTMLVGTPPELEMALYTICYYARPNDVCNVSLGGVKFNIYTHAFRYFGKDPIDLGIMFV